MKTIQDSIIDAVNAFPQIHAALGLCLNPDLSAEVGHGGHVRRVKPITRRGKAFLTKNPHLIGRPCARLFKLAGRLTVETFCTDEA